jgi:hypothetical protein
MDGLVVRVGVHGGGEAALDAEVVEQDLGDGGEAVGGARGVGHELVLDRVVLLLVDTQHHGDVGILGRRRDHHLLGARLQVLGRRRLVAEDTGRLHHDPHAHLAPWQGRRILLGADAHLASVDENRFALVGDLGVENAVDRVVLEEVGQRLGVREVVDRHHLDLRRLECRSEEHPADTSESVDPDPHAHGALLDDDC